MLRGGSFIGEVGGGGGGGRVVVICMDEGAGIWGSICGRFDLDEVQRENFWPKDTKALKVLEGFKRRRVRTGLVQ